MNTTEHDSNSHSTDHSARSIRFYCAAPKAEKVELEGNFNNWRPFPMTRTVDGWWTAQVELCHGRHQYRFRLDGHPVLDPHSRSMIRNENDEQVSLVAVS